MNVGKLASKIQLNLFCGVSLFIKNRWLHLTLNRNLQGNTKMRKLVALKLQ